MSRASSPASPGARCCSSSAWALIHHMLGGIRHLIWDTGHGLDKVSIEIFAWATIIGFDRADRPSLARGLLAQGRSSHGDPSCTRAWVGLGPSRHRDLLAPAADGRRQHPPRPLPHPVDRHPYRCRLCRGEAYFAQPSSRLPCSRSRSRLRSICASG